MMKKIALYCFLGMGLLSCTANQADTSLAKNTHLLFGHIKNAAKLPLSIKTFNGISMENFRDTTLDENGNFSIEIPDTNLLVCQLVVNNNVVLPLVISGNKSQEVSASYPDLMGTFQLKNDPHYETLKQYFQQMAAFLHLQDSIIAQSGKIDKNDTATINAIRSFLLEEKKPIEQFVKNYIQQNPASPINIMFAQELYPSNGIENWDTSYLPVLKNMQQAYQKTFPKVQYTNSLAEQITAWEGAIKQYAVFKEKNAIYKGKKFKIAVGEEAPEIVMKNPNGKTLKLSATRGKYVLLDFWASWCRPCRIENPNVVAMYNKYKDKEFTVFSVSLDKDFNAWTKAIQDDHLSWTNHVCDYDGWDSFIASIYNISAIPSNFLLDKKGNIIAINLKGQQLEQKLLRIFNQ
jgi:peroxiredoxin